MSLVVYKYIGLRFPKLMSIKLLIADHTVKRSVGVMRNVLIKMASFILPNEFMILDYELYFHDSIIIS